MRYDEKSGIILISLAELITLSLCRLASESAADGEEFAPRPIEEHLKKNLKVSEAFQNTMQPCAYSLEYQ